MNIMQVLLIGCGVLGGLLLFALIFLFFVSRRSQKVMESLLLLLTKPERAKIQDAARVLHTILSGEMEKIDVNFKNIQEALNNQIEKAVELEQSLIKQNEQLSASADDATKKLAIMSQRLDNTVSDLQIIVTSERWQDVGTSTDKFSATVNDLLNKIDTTTQDTTDKISTIQESVSNWLSSGEVLVKNFDESKNQMEQINAEYDAMNKNITELNKNAVDGFENVKSAAANYEETMTQNNKLLDGHLVKMDSFSKQSKKQLTSQMNTLTNTANVVGGQVRLAESSVEKQIRKLSDVVEKLMTSATATESAVRNISTELATLTNRFNSEIKEFATSVVSELKTVSGVANNTLENTRTAAGAFSESVKAMATGVRETLIEMNTAHTQLSGQSANLIKMSAETTAQLQPLSELIEKYYSALPDLSETSVSTGANLEKIVASLNEKIALMKSTVEESTTAVSESAVKLEDLAGQSRQQMIDLMSDYAKAVNTMQTLNKQMMVARATAPMDAIGAAPAPSFGRISSQDFLKQSEKMFEKMHEQSIDLTRAIGAEIPDVVWKKYHAGDKTIFSKWLAKMMNAADKKQIRDKLKSDTVFRSQATQFVRSFDKLLAAAQQADSTNKLYATLEKTDLGQIYVALKGHI